MPEPTLADVVARLEAIEKRLEKLDAIEEQFLFVEVASNEEPEETFVQRLRQIKADREFHSQAAQASLGQQPSSPGKKYTRQSVSGKLSASQFTIELDVEEDGRIIAEVPEIPGVLVYGATEAEALVKVQTLALHVLADKVEHGEAEEEVQKIFRIRTTDSNVGSQVLT